MDALNRQLAPFGEDTWQAIDEAATKAATQMLTARRFLDVEGPFGLGLTAIEAGADDIAEHDKASKAVAILASAVPVPMLWKGFNLSLRRLAAHAEHGQPLDLTAVEQAAEAVARLEERLIYGGDEAGNVPGLMTASGAAEIGGADWGRLDNALRDVLAAVTTLDDAGYRGPYALAVAPHLYNGLFRRYSDSDLLQVDHLGRLCQRGIFKAPIGGALVIDPRAGRLLIGQDLVAGFAALDGIHCRLFLSESIALRIQDRRALCRIAVSESQA